MDKNTFDLALGDFVSVVKPSYKGIQNWVNKKDPHPFGHIDFISSGKMDIEIDGKSYVVEADQILCIPQNKGYTAKVKKSAYSYYSFYFSYTTNTDTDEFPFPVVFKPDNVQYFKDKFKAAYQLSLTEPYGYKIKIREIFYDIFAKINEEHINKQDNGTGVYTIRKSIDYINKNFDSPYLTSIDIADASSISVTHFRRIFKSFYGISPVKYINNLKITRAKELLKSKMYSVTEALQLSGFAEMSHFSREFKKSTGISPSEYKKSAQ